MEEPKTNLSILYKPNSLLRYFEVAAQKNVDFFVGSTFAFAKIHKQIHLVFKLMALFYIS